MLDHDPIRLNRIMISSFCWSMISAQTLRVCREGKPVPTFPDHALRRRNCQQAGNAAPADIVDAREHHVIALDFHHHRRGQTLAVELAERHRKVGRMAIPADREVGAEGYLRWTLRTPDRDLPFAAPGRGR